jgi:hypothetical protein
MIYLGAEEGVWEDKVVKGRESGGVGNCGDVALSSSLCAFSLRAIENRGVGDYESLPNPLHRKWIIENGLGKIWGPSICLAPTGNNSHRVGKHERGSKPSKCVAPMILSNSPPLTQFPYLTTVLISLLGHWATKGQWSVPPTVGAEAGILPRQKEIANFGKSGESFMGKRAAKTLHPSRFGN